MNLFKKIALGIALVAGFQVSAGVINLTSLLNGKRDETTVRKVIFECTQKYPKLVFFFGTELCRPCRKMKEHILALLNKYRDVMFVFIDLAKYPYLKEGSWPKIEFCVPPRPFPKKGYLTQQELDNLLNQYYR
jgi:thiol-disulfide isomerase/thioredoxin